MSRTKKIAIIAVLCAAAYVVMAVGRIPILSVPSLKYDPKDVIITIGGFIFGPLYAVIIAVIVSVVELSVSDTGLIGMVMNIISSCVFAGTASVIYKKKHNLKGAIFGLCVAVVATICVMMIWNYILTPIYLKVPREAVVKLLLPAILPFNLLKSTLNGAIVLLIYKPLTTALRKANLLPQPQPQPDNHPKISLGLVAASIFVIITCALLFWALHSS